MGGDGLRLGVFALVVIAFTMSIASSSGSIEGSLASYQFLYQCFDVKNILTCLRHDLFWGIGTHSFVF